ncbi:hypothetical protein DFS34DRAFT_421807 [Phlyctochytrium arcticum]|nr:hypothetical protein DFS34DRAFT_421807 [Phlyctochytrium arcticum]
MPALILPDESRAIKNATRGSEVLASTIARIYTSQRDQWTYTGNVGAVVLSRKTSGKFAFQLVEVPAGRIVWEYEFVDDVSYQKDQPFFHSFVGTDSMIGLSFADEGEASDFYDIYIRKESYAASKASSPAAPVSGPPPPARNVPPPPTLAPAPLSSATSSSLGMIPSASSDSIRSGGGMTSSPRASGIFSSGTKKGKGDKKRRVDPSQISAPSNFQHITHVGYNPSSGFTAHNIPKEWQLIFEKAGITSEQLSDKKTAKFVQKFMKQHAADVNAEQAAPAIQAPPTPAAPPAIPNSGSSRRAPPPPPPSRRQAPPPPPARGPTISAQTPPPPEPARRAPVPVPAAAGPPPTPARPIPQPPPASGGGPRPPPPPAPPASGPPPPPARPDATRSTPAPAAPLSGGNPSDLLAAIRGAGGIGALKTSTGKADGSTTPPKAVDSSNLADILRDQLMKKRAALEDSDSDEDVEESGDDW